MEFSKVNKGSGKVIICEADIYVAAAEALGCDTIQVPNISLADSIIDYEYKKGNI